MATTAKGAKKSSRGSGTTKPKNLPATKEAPSAAPAQATAPRRRFAPKDGVLLLEHTPELLAQFESAFGSSDCDFQSYAFAQIMNLFRDIKDVSVPGNAAIAFLAALKPVNEVEALLAVQMFMAHHHSMLAAHRLAGSNLLEQASANGNLATKFSRTFAMQLDTLSRLRRGGEQIVKHVHVNEGGQAVIAGTVNSGGASA